MTDWTTYAERGARVRLSADGKRHFPVYRFRLGTFVGMTKTAFAKVIMDGNKTASTWHPDFFELVTDGERGDK